jgi:hypothetical protein
MTNRKGLRPFCDEVTFPNKTQIMKIEFPNTSRDQIPRYGGQQVAHHFSAYFCLVKTFPPPICDNFMFLGWLGCVGVGIPIESLSRHTSFLGHSWGARWAWCSRRRRPWRRERRVSHWRVGAIRCHRGPILPKTCPIGPTNHETYIKNCKKLKILYKNGKSSFRLKFGRVYGCPGERTDHTQLSPLTFTGSGLTKRRASRFSWFSTFLEIHFITE